MSLTNVQVMKETIGLGSYEDEWIHNSMISTSPFGDFVVVSSSTNAVFYIKKFMPVTQTRNKEPTSKSKPYFQILRTYSTICDTAGEITAVRYLPIKVVSSSGRTHDMWHCVVIGYSTGLVEIVAADSGDVLLSKQFSKPNGDTSGFRVINIQYLASSVANGAVNRSSNSYQTKTLAIPKLQEMIIVMNSTLAVLDSSSLFSALLKSRNDISANRTNGIEESHKLPSIPFKRYKVKDQSKIVDAIAYSLPNVLLDQYHQISMNKELLNEEHLRTLRHVTTYVTVGSAPFIQHNCPHQLGPQNINELAANVVSTVKSGLFRAATGFIGSWTGGNPDNEEQKHQPDPEQYLHIRHAFKDNTKSAVCIRVSPDGKYSAILDEHNRIMLLDNGVNGNGAGSGTVIHIWKGYHHAQIGWITTSWEDRKCYKSDKIPQDLEISVLLVLYLPRRGLLEVWSPEQMFRVLEFPVGKHGRLISCTNALLDENSIPSPFSVRTISECTFLEPSGIIRHIYIPISSLTTKSSSHDTVIRKQLFALSSDEKPQDDIPKNSEPMPCEEENTKKITALILSAKSTMGKIEMLIELFQVWKVAGTSNQKLVLKAVASQLSESETAIKRCTVLQNLIDFYDFLIMTTNTRDRVPEDTISQQMTQETIIQILACSSKEAEDILNVYTNCHTSNTSSESLRNGDVFDFSSFISCFDLKYSSFGETEHSNPSKKLKISLKTKCASMEMIRLCRLIAISSNVNLDGLADIMMSSKISNGHALISNYFNNAIRYCDLKNEGIVIEWLQQTVDSSSFRAFCDLAFRLHETNGDGSSFQTLIQCARLILVRDNPISFASYVVALSWKNFLAGGSGDDGQKRFKSYLGEWQHSLFLMEGFITIARTANENLHHGYQENSKGPNYTLHDVFNSGDGSISEIFVRWMLDRGVKLNELTFIDEPTCIRDDNTAGEMKVAAKEQSDETHSGSSDFDIKRFLQTCKEYFPMSSRKEILLCHMTWEYFHRWSKNHKKLTLITEGAIPCLQHISQASIQHRLTALCWTTFVSKITIEAVNLTENRSSTRCEREIGLQESDLSIFLSAAAKILRLLVDSAEVEVTKNDIEILRYDEVSLNANIAGGNMYQKQHLMDHIRENCRSSDADAIAIQYQFVSVANAIWNFGIDSVKPLSLFNSQESNLFFQGSASSSTFISSGTFQSLNIFQSDHSRSVRHNRRRFLEAACDGAVASIHQTSNGELDCNDYELWCNMVIMLGKMWHMAEKLREIQITSLYRGGHDNLGAELINLLPDRSTIGHRLIHVSLLRLSKLIYFGGVDGTVCPQAEAKAKIASLASTNSNLAKQLETLKKEAAKSLPVNSSLKDTSDLLVMLSGFELEEQSQQLAYECLALTQSLRS